MSSDPALFDVSFQTARPPNPIYCHIDFLEKLNEFRSQPLGKRASLLLQRLAVDERRLHYKSTHGPNRGWRRSRLGGSGGNHFYAWWTTRASLPLRQSPSFNTAPEGALFLRAIRHHDDHSPLPAHEFHDSYLPVSIHEIRREEYTPQPWTPQQSRFANSRVPIRLLKGHPGSGKTTALLHAADTTKAERVLYLTYSTQLASLARDYFDRFCSAARTFHVAPFSTFIRQWLGVADAPTSESTVRRRFQNDLHPFQRFLGPWSANPAALYDELHAHIAGDALPIQISRFPACKAPRVPDAHFTARRAAYLGPGAASAVEAATRLERADPAASLAERYFPELALAWRAATSPVPAALLEYDCIAVDECQDLTPLESFLIARLAGAIRDRRSHSIPVLLAGDEAQTVRPTDFEWGWLNDLFHATLGTPTEFKLAANLRSPRRIAEIVNRVWDLYSHLDKKDRPSGSGMAEIEDDATDQIFYCTAAPSPDLNALLAELASREGLALIAFDRDLTAVPESLRASVLSPAEAKGLDFHSVCVLDAGRLVHKIVEMGSHVRLDHEIQGLRKRLAIDELRVALSRPAERLLWLDISPGDKTVRAALDLLNGSRPTGVSTCSPAALLKTLSEEDLDLEERIQRCQQDALQYLAVRPDLAWSRAQQAVALLGDKDEIASIGDESVRNSAWLTLAQICFSLAFRKITLSPELGRPDLFDEARRAAHSAHRSALARTIAATGYMVRALPQDRLTRTFELIESIISNRSDLESWFIVEITPAAKLWLDDLEYNITAGSNSALFLPVLPKICEVLGLPDASQRLERARKRALDAHIKNKNWNDALAILRTLPDRQLKLEASCLQALGNYARAAAVYREAGLLADAIDCLRAIPDFQAALNLLRESGASHPAADSLEWIARVEALVAERPANFLRVMKASEKRLLEKILEDALGAKRAKKAPAVKKSAPAKRSTRPK